MSPPSHFHDMKLFSSSQNSIIYFIPLMWNLSLFLLAQIQSALDLKFLITMVNVICWPWMMTSGLPEVWVVAGLCEAVYPFLVEPWEARCLETTLNRFEVWCLLLDPALPAETASSHSLVIMCRWHRFPLPPFSFIYHSVHTSQRGYFPLQ